ncbi:uncharacterized protein LOC110983763 isoform X2 [Acanthaster planci]|uniref:Uncharacterized protein LOC110983763 isoform X2 n=1 Tax=Acanthaster planci TaxID=133434 RepID=A0A8B7Z1Z5_ACAPL|nr:uncharacterized protein LOC110983763 isoform X2 [Acanthaster planci]
MEQGVVNEWAASVESTEPDSDKFGHTENDEDDSDVSHSTDSKEAGSRETQVPVRTHVTATLTVMRSKNSGWRKRQVVTWKLRMAAENLHWLVTWLTPLRKKVLCKNGVKGDSSVVGPLPVGLNFWYHWPDRVRR